MSHHVRGGVSVILQKGNYMLLGKTLETFYITQYALTKGIIEDKGEIVLGSQDRMIRVDRRDMYLIGKPFWHTRKEDAIEHAETMRVKKIKSLEKQIEKLKNLKFKQEP